MSKEESIAQLDAAAKNKPVSPSCDICVAKLSSGPHSATSADLMQTLVDFYSDTLNAFHVHECSVCKEKDVVNHVCAGHFSDMLKPKPIVGVRHPSDICCKCYLLLVAV